jgi:hypothetical protein
VQSSKNANPVLPPYPSDDVASGVRGRVDLRFAIDDRLGSAAAPVTNISSYPLRLLLSETSAPEASSNSLRSILSDGIDGPDDPPKKRHRGLAVKDDIVQLPQPVKKQKATQQQVMPPIINGLLEPPPDAALFPPISDNDPTQLKLLHELAISSEDRGSLGVLQHCDSSGGPKTRRRAAKPRRKWTEEETKHLLLGVSKHGVGKWTSILEDPEFQFNDRTAGDLKDRFRTCCPEELRVNMRKQPRDEAPTSSANSSTAATPTKPAVAPAPPKQKAKTGLLSENILIDSEDESRSNTPTPLPTEPAETEEPGASSSKSKAGKSAKPKKSRAHRKKVEDLAELGILGPFKKSRRRERRPFTDQDDQEILQGLDLYGPAWTKIHRDPRFSLSGRQPTDLRDRVRNKYPNIYSRIEKGAFQVKDPSRANDLLEPSVNMMIENSSFPSTSVKHPTGGGGSRSLLHVGSSSREDVLKWPMSFDLHEPAASAVSGSGAQVATTTGEMDISRFLVDNPSEPRDTRFPVPGPLSRSVSPTLGPRRDWSPGRR